MNQPPPPSPSQADKAFACGVAYQAKGDLFSATREWRLALILDPEHAPALYNLAVALALAGDEKGCEENYQKLLALQPSHKEGLFNLANLRRRQGRDSDAEKLYLQLTEVYPDFASGWVNLAKLYSDRGNVDAALPIVRKAIALEPNLVIAHWNLSHLLLRSRLWEEAWREYEWRLQLPTWLKLPLQVPEWKPDLSAKRVLLWNDQGMGDAIQFLRYAPLLAERGHEVWVLAQQSLKTIVATAPGVTGAIGPSDSFPDIDAQAPLMSMPYRLGLPEPVGAEKPYLSAPRKMSLPGRSGRLAVGLVWAGNDKFKNDHDRSANLSALKSLFDLEGIDWYSLQFGEARTQIDKNNLSGKIKDLTPQLSDFSDTASALEALDLVVSVDTSVAHLAGALGRPCFLMLSASPDWRFATDEVVRLWYNSLRPFRQTSSGDWPSVAAQIVEAIKQELS